MRLGNLPNLGASMAGCLPLRLRVVVDWLTERGRELGELGKWVAGWCNVRNGMVTVTTNPDTPNISFPLFVGLGVHAFSGHAIVHNTIRDFLYSAGSIVSS